VSSDFRSPLSIHVRLCYSDLETFVSGFASNISTSGMFIQSRTPPDVGSPLRFELSLSGGTTVVRGEGEVVWIKDFDERSPKEPYGVGVRFTQLDEASRVIVDRVVATKGVISEPAQSGTAEVHALQGKATLTQLMEGPDMIASLLEQADVTLARLIEESSLTPEQLTHARVRARERVQSQSLGLEELDRLLAETPHVSLDRESALMALRERFGFKAPPAVRQAQQAPPLERAPSSEQPMPNDEDISTAPETHEEPVSDGKLELPDQPRTPALESQDEGLDPDLATHVEFTAEACEATPPDPQPQEINPTISRTASIVRAAGESDEVHQFDLSEASIPGHPAIEAPPRPASSSAAEEQLLEVDEMEEIEISDLDEIEIDIEAPPLPPSNSHISDFDQEHHQLHPDHDDLPAPNTVVMSAEVAQAPPPGQEGNPKHFQDFSSFDDVTCIDEPTLLSANTMQDPDMEDSAFDELAAPTSPRHSAPSLDDLVDEIASAEPPEKRRKKHTSDVFRRLFGKK